MERDVVARMLEGNRRDYSDPILVSPQVRIATEDRHPELNASQLQAADDIFLAREKIVALDGVAGAGKTTTLAVIREGAEIEGYRVEGFAPTSRAAHKLGEAGIETSTLQKHLARGYLRARQEHRYRYQPAHRGATGWDQTHLRSPPTAGRVCVPGGNAGIFRR